MKLLRIKAVAKKELIQIWRDPLSLAMAFMMPVMLLFIFGYAITLDVNNLKTVVYDLDKSSASRELIEAFSSSGYFTVVGNVNQQKEIDRYLDTGQAFVAISIPRDFSEKMKTGRDTSLQVIVDGSDSNTATIALGYISAITERYSLRTRGGSITPLIDPRVRVWYNPELKSRNFIIPGLIAIIMAVITALLTSLTIAREWERGTMEQLIATPIKTPELILGKLIPYFFIGFIDVILSALLAVFLFEVPLRGEPSAAYAAFKHIPVWRSESRHPHIDSSKVPACGEPDRDDRNVPAGLSAFRVHVFDIKHAEAASVLYPADSGEIFCDNSQGHISEGQYPDTVDV